LYRRLLQRTHHVKVSEIHVVKWYDSRAFARPKFLLAPFPKAGSTLAANSRGIKRFLTPAQKTHLAAWCATPCGHECALNTQQDLASKNASCRMIWRRVCCLLKIWNFVMETWMKCEDSYQPQELFL
jgi:hypothetical protein